MHAIDKSAVLAGVLISFGALFAIAAAPYGNVAQGLCFSVGLFGVLCCDALLFTGQVLSIQRVWSGEKPLRDVLRTWAGVWCGNLIGAVCVALVAAVAHVDASYAAQYKAAMPWPELLARAALCNVMVCLAVWARRKGVPELSAALLPVACFVACGFEHSVADMFYMGLGVIGGYVSLLDVVYVLALATVGNVVGGIVFAWLVDGKENK